MEKDITIYSTPVCMYCQKAKEFFAAHNLAYTEVDVTKDLTLIDRLREMTGQMGVPVIVIGNEDILVGYDESKLKQLLGIS